VSRVYNMQLCDLILCGTCSSKIIDGVIMIIALAGVFLISKLK